MGCALRTLASIILLAAVGGLSSAAADVADDILAKAIERYQAGEVQPAIGGINAALRGRLSGAQLAKAYYYRGLAHRKLGEPGQAITDLTQALEYGGLSDAERSDAKENLQVAYQEAGISENERVIVAHAQQPRAPSKAVPTPAATDQVTGSVEMKKPAPAVVTTTPPGPWQTLTASVPEPAAATTPAPQPTSSSKQQIALAPLPPAPVTKKTSTPAPTPTQTKQATPAPQRPATTPQPSAFVTQVSVPPPEAPSEIHLLVGEAHSRNEAFELAIRLTSQRGAELGPRRPQITEMKFADTSVYRLRLGPFADAAHATALCRSLRDSGYDCVSE